MALVEESFERINLSGTAFDIAFQYRPASGDLVIFLHGLGCSKETFENVWSCQALNGFSLLAYDMLGFGHSDRPETFSYAMEDQALILEALFRKFSESRLHVVAHSMGGAVGLLASESFIDSLKSFTNVEGNLIGDDCGLLSRQTAGHSLESFQREFLPNLKSLFDGQTDHRISLHRAAPLAFYQSALSLVAWSDSGKLLNKFMGLDCKKIYFYGEQNRRMKVLAMLEGIIKREISNSGHFPMNDNPNEFYNQLGFFISDNPRPETK